MLHTLRMNIGEVGMALRRPEQLAVRWRDRRSGGAPSPAIFYVLLGNAVVGTAGYGLTMHLDAGLGGMLSGAFYTPLAAGIAWTIALPALYIIHSALGAKLDLSTTLLAASTTVSFGALAMLASVPINWFFSLALPYAAVRLAVNIVIFAGVGVSMVDVFLRVMRAVEPKMSVLFAYVWLALVAVIGCEFFSLFGVFSF